MDNRIKVKPINSYLVFSYNHEFLKIIFDKDKINLQLSFCENKPFDNYKAITKETKSENKKIKKI